MSIHCCTTGGWGRSGQERAGRRGERRARAGGVGKSRGRAAAEGRAALVGWSRDRSARRSIGAVAATTAALGSGLKAGGQALGETPAPAAAALPRRRGCGAVGPGPWPGALGTLVLCSAPENALRSPAEPPRARAPGP